MSKTVKWYINCAIALGIMVFFRFIPAPEPMTQMGITVVGIFLGAIYGWCTTNMIWPSIAALILYGLTGAAPIPQTFGALFSAMGVQIVFWLMLCVGLLRNVNLIQYMANWSISRKFTEGKAWLLITCIFLCDIICGIALDAIAVILVFWALLQTLCAEVGYEKGSRTGAWLMISVVVITQFGGFILPFKPAVVTLFGFLSVGSGGVYDGTFDYANWILFTTVVSAIIFVVYMLFSKYVLKIDLSKFAEFKVESVELQPLDRRQKACLILFLILMVLLLVPSFKFLPQSFFLVTLVNKLGTVGCAMLMIGIVCLLHVNGEPLLTLDDLMNKNVVWSVIFMFGTALYLCTFINGKDSGVSAWLQGVFNPVFGSMSPFVFVAYYLIVGIITNFINNAVVGALMVPISYGFCTAMGLNPVALCCCIILFVDFGILLPSSSPSGSMLHNSKGWIPKKDLYPVGLFAVVIFVVVSLFIGWPLANMLFPFAG